MYQSDDEQLRTRAYAIWEREGCPDGKHQEHWDLAVKEMAGQAAPSIDQGPWRIAQEDSVQPKAETQRGSALKPGSQPKLS
jgi:hypothetical protein